MVKVFVSATICVISGYVSIVWFISIYLPPYLGCLLTFNWWMPDIFNVMLLSPEFCCSLLELASALVGSPVSYWAVWSFGGLKGLQQLSLQTPESKASLPHNEGMTLLGSLHTCSRVSSLWLRGTPTSPSAGWALRIVGLTAPPNCSFWALWSVTWPTRGFLFSWRFKGIIPR